MVCLIRFRRSDQARNHVRNNGTVGFCFRSSFALVRTQRTQAKTGCKPKFLSFLIPHTLSTSSYERYCSTSWLAGHGACISLRSGYALCTACSIACGEIQLTHPLPSLPPPTTSPFPLPSTFLFPHSCTAHRAVRDLLWGSRKRQKKNDPILLCPLLCFHARQIPERAEINIAP